MQQDNMTKYYNLKKRKTSIKKKQRWVRCFFPPSPWCLRVKLKLRFLRLLSVLYIRLCPEAVHLGAADTTSSNVDNIYGHFRVTTDVWTSFAFVWDTSGHLSAMASWVQNSKDCMFFLNTYTSLAFTLTQPYYTANDSAWTVQQAMNHTCTPSDRLQWHSSVLT